MTDSNTSTDEPSITFLNMTGDITIAWDAENREHMLALIEEKMRQGYSFFILKPRVLGLFGSKKVAIDDISAARAAGSVIVEDQVALSILKAARLDDPALEAAVTAGSATLVRGGTSGNVVALRRATSAAEAVSRQTVAVRPIVGG